MNREIGLFPKMLFVIFLVALIPLTGLFYINSVRIRQTVQNNVELNLRKTTETLATQVNGWTDTNLRLLNQHASHPDIISMQTDLQVPTLASVESSYEWIYRVVILDLNGYGNARSSGDSIFGESGEKIFFRGDRRYFQQIVQGSSEGQQVLLSRSTGKPALCLSVPINNSTATADSMVGVLFACSFLDVLSEAITNTRVGNTGFAMLLNDEGKLIAHGDNPALLSEELQDFSSHPALQKDNTGVGQLISYDYNDVPVVAQVSDVGLGWKLIVQQESAEAFASITQTRRNGLILLLSTIFLVILAAYWLARLLVKPIEKLTSIAEDISRGNLEQVDDDSIDNQRSDEIGKLARAIERLRVSVKLMLEELQEGGKS